MLLFSSVGSKTKKIFYIWKNCSLLLEKSKEKKLKIIYLLKKKY